MTNNTIAPFYIDCTNLTKEQVITIVDKSIDSGCEVHEVPLGSKHKILGLGVEYNKFQYWGVNPEYYTITTNFKLRFGDDAIEIKYEDLDKHLGLSSNTEIPPQNEPVTNTFSQMTQSYYDGIKSLSRLSGTLETPITINNVDGEIEFTLYVPFMDRDEVVIRSDDHNTALQKLEEFASVYEKMKSFY